MFLIRLLFLVFLVCGCGSGGFHKTMRIGIDTKWYPIDFGLQTAYVNGYTEDFLLEMARYSGMTFELVPANWDTLEDGLKKKKYDAILTSMEPYEYLTAKYDFSNNYLDLGPVLILPFDASQKSLKDLGGNPVGIITNSQTATILETYPTILIRSYNSIPDLLNAVVRGDIQGALLPRLPAMNFVSDLYAGKLKVVGEPLSSAGLRLVGPKGSIYRFNKCLEALKKRKAIDPLLKKWSLGF